ncbi:DNA-binding response regulator [Desmospora sp. 8437]|nr:DNA-binding response regulator [Desmospora sp. 8437]
MEDTIEGGLKACFYVFIKNPAIPTKTAERINAVRPLSKTIAKITMDKPLNTNASLTNHDLSFIQSPYFLI